MTRAAFSWTVAGRAVTLALVAAVANGCSGSRVIVERCPGPSPDVSTDARNCGTCGHSCLDGACVAGKCQPSVVATFADQPRHLLSVGNELAVVANDGIHIVGKAGGTPRLLSEQLVPNAATDGVDVYWVWHGAWRCLSSGGCSLLAPDLGSMWDEHVLVTRGQVFWEEVSIRAFSMSDPRRTSIVAAPQKPGGSIHAFTASTTDIIWLDALREKGLTYGLRRRLLSGGDTVNLATPPSLDCAELAAIGDSIFVLSVPRADDPVIWSVSLSSGGTPTVMATFARPAPRPDGGCNSRALASNSGYLVGIINNDVFTVDPATRETRFIASGASGEAIAVDDLSVFFANGNRVMRVAK
jgi:hypothetical protein